MLKRANRYKRDATTFSVYNSAHALNFLAALFPCHVVYMGASKQTKKVNKSRRN